MTIYEFLGGAKMPRIEQAIGAVFVTVNAYAYKISASSDGSIFIESLDDQDSYWTLFYRWREGSLARAKPSMPWRTVLEREVDPRATIQGLFEQA